MSSKLDLMGLTEKEIKDFVKQVWDGNGENVQDVMLQAWLLYFERVADGQSPTDD